MSSGSVIEIELQKNEIVVEPETNEINIELQVQKVVIESGVLPGPQGVPGVPGADAKDLIVNEVPDGLIDGSNITFTTANNFIPETIRVEVNGLNQKPNTHFITTSAASFEMNESPQAGDFLLVSYQQV